MLPASLFLRDIFAAHRILGWQFLQHFRDVSLLSLACMVSYRKSLYVVMYLFSLWLCDGNFYVSTWLNHQILRNLVTHYFWVCLWRWFWMRLTCILIGPVKQIVLTGDGGLHPNSWNTKWNKKAYLLQSGRESILPDDLGRWLPTPAPAAPPPPQFKLILKHLFLLRLKPGSFRKKRDHLLS